MQSSSSEMEFTDHHRQYLSLLYPYVRTGTILLGICQIAQLLSISSMEVMVKHPLLTNITKELPKCSEIPTALNELDNLSLNTNSTTLDGSKFSNYELDYDVMCAEDSFNDSARPDGRIFFSYASSMFGIYISSLMKSVDIKYTPLPIFVRLIITLILIHGAIKKIPKMLIPFFCVQLFDALIIAMSTFDYIFYMTQISHVDICAEPSFPDLPSISSKYKHWIMIFYLLSSIITKVSISSIVLRYYDYLTLEQNSVLPNFHYIQNDLDFENNVNFNMERFPPPPPSYAVAVGEDVADHREAIEEP